MNKKTQIGEKLYSWTDIDHIKPIRGPIWYIVFVFMMILFMAWGYYDKVYSMSLVFFILCIVYLLIIRQEPASQEVIISTTGINVGNKFYSFSDINSFWVIHYGNVSLLHLKLKFKFHHEVVIPVVYGDVNLIIQLLSKKVKYLEGVSEGIDEAVARILKL